MRTPFTVLKRITDVDSDGGALWEECGELNAKYGIPTAQELGAAFGAGEYLYFDVAGYGVNRSTVVMSPPQYEYEVAKVTPVL